MDKLHIRWMIKRDMPEVLEIEGMSFAAPWSEEDFISSLKRRNCIGMVCEATVGHDDFLIGYMIYDLEKNSLNLLNFAVHPDYRRKGAGKLMVDKLIGKLSDQRRSRLTTTVSEANLEALQFFKANEFIATNIEKGYYDDSDDDAIKMIYFYGENREHLFKNRISKYYEEKE